MPVDLLKNPQMQFGAITFFAKQHKGDSCGSNGLPLTPNSIIIFGKAQILKTIKSPYLCQYLDIIRGKHERTIVVSQYCGKPLSESIEKVAFTSNDVIKIAYQILQGLKTLHEAKIVHRNLSTENVLVQDSGDVKLFNYGLYHMSDRGQLVSYPIMQLLYAPPEVYLDGPNGKLSNPKVDVWSLGIILAELVLNKFLWSSLQLGQKIRKILSLVHSNSSIFERIAREHNCYEEYSNLPVEIKSLIEDCLHVYPKDRPSVVQLLQKPIFESFKTPVKTNEDREGYQPFTINELYHWWQLAGGDVYQELKKQGLIRSSPPILSLPNLVLIEGVVLGQERNPATLYDPRIVLMPLDGLYQRFDHIPFDCYYPLIYNTSEIIARGRPKLEDATELPLVIRERDPEYQFHRIVLFRRLLHGYPFTKGKTVKESERDIPPLLRGDIWACLLGIKADYKRSYLRIDKETPTATDRQIEVDIPRCHQYNELLSSAEGHKKLKRVLKAWVFKNKQYVYWQGLDSLTAPFLYLNFNDEAKAFACLYEFVPRYLHKFFLRDNSAVIQEYLAKFSQLIAFHDPELANHLYDINFIPELFAIPWFLTMFSHVFPLHKILHLWDKLLLGDSSFPLHIGLSVLTQLRDKLLSSGFNECILLFSDLPEVDIEKCVICSLETYGSTPKSITARAHQNDKIYFENGSDVTDIPLQQLKNERCPRISADDVIALIKKTQDGVVLVDIRNPVHFNRTNIAGSINIPFSSVTIGERNIDSVGIHGNTLKNSTDKIVVVIGTEETDLEMFPTFLLECNVRRVCILHGGFNILFPLVPAALVKHNH